MRSKDLALIALFAAFMAVLGLTPRVTLPFVPAPFTLQTLGLLLAGGILGARRGAMSILLFLLLVAIGLPVLVGGAGGFGSLIGPTGGFLWSYPIAAFVCGWLVERFWNRLNIGTALIATVVASFTLYPIGHSWLAIFTKMPFETAIWSWVVYLPGDMTKAVIAAVIILAVKKAYPIIEPRREKVSAAA